MKESPENKRTYYFFNKQVHRLGDYFHRMPFPGSNGVPIYDVFTFFFKGLSKGALNIRASAIAFNFLLALGPGIIFVLTLIPFLPIRNFQQELMEILYDVIPENSYIAIESLLDEIFRKHASLQIFGFLVTVLFAHKGLTGVVDAFNATYHTVETRPWMESRLVSLALVFILFILVSFSALLLLFSKLGIRLLFEAGIIKAYVVVILLQTGKWIIIFCLTFFAISFLYYFAPARKTKWRFFSPGSLMATFLCIIASLVFSYFVNHFAPFNRFYGSIGTLIAMMLWMNFSALSLLIGFELNASIKNARIKSNEPISI
ncbi:MAG: YihY/virulence factor BrkB family protein [Bacteroidales bacterium]|nr:YihY/virulence factor BrkB family protein [Bacteroidales bacterium]